MSGRFTKKGLFTVLIIFLVFSLGFNLYQWDKFSGLNKLLAEKDRAITEIRNSIKLIAESNDSIDSIIDALRKYFSIDSEVIFRETDNTYYFVISPKDWHLADYQVKSDFYGLEIIFDNNKDFKQIDFYKP